MDLGSVIGPYKLTNGRYRLSKLSEIVDRSDSVEASHILLTSENYTIDSAKTILSDIKKIITPLMPIRSKSMNCENATKVKAPIELIK